MDFSGTFAVTSLMVRNSIKAVLAENDLEYCSEPAYRLMVIDGTNSTCNDLKVQIAVSLAFTSGLVMVCSFY